MKHLSTVLLALLLAGCAGPQDIPFKYSVRGIVGERIEGNVRGIVLRDHELVIDPLTEKEDSLWTYTELVFSPDGYLLTSCSIGKGDRDTLRSDFTYDGRTVRERGNKFGGMPVTRSFVHKKNRRIETMDFHIGVLTETDYFRDNMLVKKHRRIPRKKDQYMYYSYSYGYLDHIVCEGTSSQIIMYEYKSFDSLDNWTSRIQYNFYDGQEVPGRIIYTDREIIYGDSL